MSLSAVHPSSLLPFDAHNPALLALVSSSVRKSMIHSSISPQCVEVNHGLPTPPFTPPMASTNEQKSLNSETETEPPIKIIPLKRFIANVVGSRDASVPTLLTTLIYLERLNFPLDTIGRFDIRHRVFLATLIIADKYLNEKYPWNNDWVFHAGNLICLDDINHMERELLRSLKFNLRFDEAEALRVWQPFVMKMEMRLRRGGASVDNVDVSLAP